jgi:hypothetical protein
MISLLVVRISAVALTFTGLSRESATFQARSAFTGVGFTTSESESLVNHPVRRRVIMMLMLVGNAGVVTAVVSLLLSFTGTRDPNVLAIRLAALVGGGILLLLLSRIPWMSRGVHKLIEAALRKWTDIDVRDYAQLLKLQGEYGISELAVKQGDWLEGHTPDELHLDREDLSILGIEHADGAYQGAPALSARIVTGDRLIIYGRASQLSALDCRKPGEAGEQCHDQFCELYRQQLEEQERANSAA